MPYYNLKVLSDGRILSVAALNIDHALEIFRKEIGLSLTRDVQDAQACYLLDAWH